MTINPNFINMVESVKNNPNEADRHGLYKKCHLKEDFVVLQKTSFESELNRLPLKPAKQQKAISMIKQLGFKTPSIVYYTQSSLSSMIINKLKGKDYYEIQERAKGKELLIRNKDNSLQDEQVKESFLNILSAPTEHLAEYLNNFFIGYQLGILNDAHGSNVFYDKKEGFTFIDLPKIPLKSSVEQYQREVYEKNFNATKFIQTATNRLSLYTEISHINYYKPYNNLLSNRIIDALEYTNIPMNSTQLAEVKHFLVPEIGSYGSFSNEEQKLFLDYLETGKYGPISNYTELYPKNGFSLPSSFFGLDKKTENVNEKYLNECLDATTIKSVPARDFYNNLKEYDEPLNSSDGIDLDMYN